MNCFKWQKGRQESGYDKMLLATARYPLPFDFYILRFPTGSEIQPHIDPVGEGRHYRFNIIIKKARKGGEFLCYRPIFDFGRIKFFRPDISEHSVTKVEQGTRYVLSFGWLRK